MDFSRFASGAAAPRPGLQIGAGPSFRGACSLRRVHRHRGGGAGNLMVASALRGSSGLFYSPPTPLALRLRGAARRRCQGNDSLAYVDGPLEGTKGPSPSASADEASTGATISGSDAEEKSRAAAGDVDDLKEALQRARKELEVARLNSTMFEGKAQRISESAIALKDRAVGRPRSPRPWPPCRRSLPRRTTPRRACGRPPWRSPWPKRGCSSLPRRWTRSGAPSGSWRSAWTTWRRRRSRPRRRRSRGARLACRSMRRSCGGCRGRRWSKFP